MTQVQRPLHQVARDIFKTWPNMYFGAKPYANAMLSVSSIEDMYGDDDAKSLVLYFLSNATTWRGDDARRIKSELKQIAGIK